MATAGFEVYGSHGTVQITDRFPNYVFKDAFAVACTFKADPAYNTKPPGSFLKNYQTSFSIKGVAPLYAINSTAPLVLFDSWGRIDDPENNIGVTITLASTDAIPYFEVFVFDTMPNVQTSVGLNVFKADGTVAFNSDANPMRIVRVQPIAANSPPVSATGLPSSKYAGMLAVPSHIRTTTGTGGYGLVSTSTSVYEAPTTYEGTSLSGDVQSMSRADSAIIVVDVAGLPVRPLPPPKSK